MARIGMNPARKGKISFQPQEVSVGMLTYIPGFEGYFQHRLEVLKVSINSLLVNTEIPFDFFILDNGSCSQVVSYLLELNEAEKVDVLLLSTRNLGVEGGMRILSSVVPGRYFAFSNDDVYYYPGWLQKHLEILRNFPDVGMVSGTPVGYSSEDANKSVQDFISRKPEGLKVSQRERIRTWEKDWAESTGRDVEIHLRSISKSPQTILEFSGTKAIESATHFQFVSPSDVIPQAFSPVWEENLMDGMIEMDQRVDSMGYLRLSTPERVTRHIGNSITGEFITFAEKLNQEIEVIDKRKRKRNWILKIPGTGRILRGIYNWLFEVLHPAE